MNALRSETFVLTRRPLAHAFGATWAFIVAALGYGVPLIVAATMTPGDARDLLVAELGPGRALGTILGVYPTFGGVFLALGACAGGAEFGWGTWPARLIHGPSRWEIVRAKFATTTALAALIALAADLLGLAVSYIVALVAHLPTAPPDLTRLLAAFGASMLTAAAFAACGLALALLSRSLVVALAAGLLWVAVENLACHLLTRWPHLAQLCDVLLTPAVCSLATTFGAAPLGGAAPNLLPSIASAILVAYLLLATIVTGVAINRRDICTARAGWLKDSGDTILSRRGRRAFRD